MSVNLEMPLEVETDKPITEETPGSISAKVAEKDLGKSRIGITKKIYRPVAEKKARKLAKKMRKLNRRK